MDFEMIVRWIDIAQAQLWPAIQTGFVLFVILSTLKLLGVVGDDIFASLGNVILSIGMNGVKVSTAADVAQVALTCVFAALFYHLFKHGPALLAAVAKARK